MSEVKSENVVKKEKKRKHDDDYGSTQVTVSGLSLWHISLSQIVFNN